MSSPFSLVDSSVTESRSSTVSPISMPPSGTLSPLNTSISTAGNDDDDVQISLSSFKISSSGSSVVNTNSSFNTTNSKLTTTTQSIMKAQSSSVLPNARTQIYTKRSPSGLIGKRTRREKESVPSFREGSPSASTTFGIRNAMVEMKVEDVGRVKLPPATSASTSCFRGKGKGTTGKGKEVWEVRDREERETEREKERMGLYEWDYFDDVKEYMREFQDYTLPSVSLIDQQPELEWFMRPYLVDFLIEIHSQYSLRPETLFLTLNIIDRYVSKRVVYKKHYQLVGCAALWIAAKFEDRKERVPSVGDLKAMCCSAYDEGAFVQMEGHVLTTIEWIVGGPTPEAFLRLECAEEWEDTRVKDVARFLMEITLFKREFIGFRPEEIAGAGLVLARWIVGKGRRFRNESPEVFKIVSLLDAQLSESLDQISIIVIKKYSTKYRSHASTMVRQWYLSGNRFCEESWNKSPIERGPKVLGGGGRRVVRCEIEGMGGSGMEEFGVQSSSSITSAVQHPSVSSIRSSKSQQSIISSSSSSTSFSTNTRTNSMIIEPATPMTSDAESLYDEGVKENVSPTRKVVAGSGGKTKVGGVGMKRQVPLRVNWGRVNEMEGEE